MKKVNSETLDLKEEVVQIRRVSKVLKGGRRFSFSALVVVGDKNGYVGAGLGKAKEVPSAIRKGIEHAKKNLIKVSLKGTTIPYKIVAHFAAAKVLLKPASPGTGIIAGGSVRAVVKLSGIQDILTKSLGSKSALNNVWATLKGLKSLKSAAEIAKLRGKTVEEILKI